MSFIQNSVYLRVRSRGRFVNPRKLKLPPVYKIKERLFNREKWDEAVKELQTFLGDDPYHINILWEQLNFVSFN